MILKTRFFRNLVLSVLCFLIYLAVLAIRIIPRPESIPFDRYIFSDICAVLNLVTLFALVFGVFAIKRGKKILHIKIMSIAIIASVFFLFSYLGHHYIAGETRYAGTGARLIIYRIILVTHILSSAMVLPLVLWTASFAMLHSTERHKKWAQRTCPLWIYVSISGLIIYAMISPYYLR